MTTLSRNHKPLPELDVDPADIPALVEAARAVAGSTVARNLGGWLMMVHAGIDATSVNQAVRFRKVLRQVLDGHDGAAPPPSTTPSRRRRGQTGYAQIRTLARAGALSSAAMVAATGRPLALLACPIILGEPGYVDLGDQEGLARAA